MVTIKVEIECESKSAIGALLSEISSFEQIMRALVDARVEERMKVADDE